MISGLHLRAAGFYFGHLFPLRCTESPRPWGGSCPNGGGGGAELAQVLKDFEFRHRNLGALLLANFQRVQGRVLSQTALSEKRKLLLGALFSGEYALESAAIFNPSIVPHPDQSESPKERYDS